MRRGSLSAKEITNVNLGNDVTDCFFRLNGMCYHKDRSPNTCEGEKCKQYRSGKPLQKMKDGKKEISYKKQEDIALTTRKNHRKK